MRLLFQILTVIIITVLSHSRYVGGVIDYALVFLWLFTWVSNKDRVLAYAIGLGIAFDLLSYLPFGAWIVINIGLINLIDYLKTNFLTVSSAWQAIMILAIMTLLLHSLISVVTGEFNYLSIAYSAIANVVLGAMAYYLVATKLKMIQRWSGRVL